MSSLLSHLISIYFLFASIVTFLGEDDESVLWEWLKPELGNFMETEKAAFLQQSFNKVAHDMDQMQSFCFDLKVNIFYFEVATSVYVCKYSLCYFFLSLMFLLCSFSLPTPPKKKYIHNTLCPLKGENSVYLLLYMF